MDSAISASSHDENRNQIYPTTSENHKDRQPIEKTIFRPGTTGNAWQWSLRTGKQTSEAYT